MTSARSIFPPIVLACALACGSFAMAYAWAFYEALPASVPTHFAASGEPDGFRPKSLPVVMLPSLLTLVAGTLIAGIAWFVELAQPSVRIPGVDLSLAAESRIRRVVTRMLVALSVTLSLFLTTLSVGSVRVGLGRADRLPPVFWPFVAALALILLGTAISIAFQSGQGGAKVDALDAERTRSRAR